MKLFLQRQEPVGGSLPLPGRLNLAGARLIAWPGRFTAVQAGGPGSGCTGPNCGRPAGYELPKGIPWHKAREMPLHPTWVEHHNWHKQAYGGVVVNRKGQFLLREPANHFDGYHWTWPKGTVGDAKEHPAETAFREVAEETGRKGLFIGQLPGTYKSGSGGHSNFYLMRSGGNHPEYMDDETWRTHWASYDEAKKLISQSKNEMGRQRDLAILERAHKHLSKYEVQGAGEHTGHFDFGIQAGGPGSGRHPGFGKWTPNGLDRIVSVDKHRYAGGPVGRRADWLVTAWDKSHQRGMDTEKENTYPGLAVTPASQITTPVGFSKQNLIGWVLVHNPGVYSKHTVVHPDMRRQGVATQMYSHFARQVGPLSPSQGEGIGQGQTDLGKKFWQGYKKNIQAGGPGSGCHGPNCGRPKTAHAMLVNKGWKKIGSTVKVLNKASGLHSYVSYKHPKYGIMKIEHLFSLKNTFEHITPAGVSNKLPVGKFAKNIQTYLENLHSQPAVQPAPAVSSKPPAGMPDAFIYPTTGDKFTYNPATKEYETGTGTISIREANRVLSTPVSKPTSGRVPEGMEKSYTSGYGSTTWTYNPDTGKYHSPDSPLTYSPAHVKGWATTGVVVPGTKAIQPEPAKTGPPAGMPEGIKGPKGGVYNWHEGNQNYTHGKNEEYQISPDKAKALLQKGTYTSVGKTTPITEQVKTEFPTTKASPTISTTPVPQSMGLKPEQFTFKESGKALGGAHDKYVYTDNNGNSWLFKPATTLGGQASPVMAHADEMASRIAQAIRPGYSIEAKAITMDVPGQGKVFGSIQKMIPADVLRGEGGKFKDFTGRDFNASPLQPWETKHLQQEQVLDWLISNHDSHGGQFLRTSGKYVGSRSVIGIDKTQAFKYFGADTLSATYHPNATYGEKPPIYNDMWQAVKSGKLTVDPEDALPAIKLAEGISRDDYKAILQPYADARFQTGAEKEGFFNQAIARKENLRSDFEKFYSDVLDKKGFKFEPQYDPSAVVTVNVKSGKKEEGLPDNEVRPNGKATIQANLPVALGKYKDTGKDQLDSSVIDAWQKGYNKSDPTLPEAQRWAQGAKNAGLYPELAQKIGLLPTDLHQLKSAISGWKGSTSTEGAAYIRAGAQDVLTAGKELKSRFSAALQLEYEITKAKLAEMYPSKTMDLYRGLSATVADQLKKAKAVGGQVEYHTMGAEGWTSKKTTASGFSSGVMLHVANMPIENVIHSWKTNPNAQGGYVGEQESFVAFPGKVQYLQHSNIITSARMAKKKQKIVVVDGTKGMTHHAVPPDWKQGTKPVEIIEMIATDKDGKSLVGRK